jgi:hypothetical protein
MDSDNESGFRWYENLNSNDVAIVGDKNTLPGDMTSDLNRFKGFRLCKYLSKSPLRTFIRHRSLRD